MLKKNIAVVILLMAVIPIISFADNANPTQEPKVLQVLTRYLEAWKTRDINEIGKLYADSVSIYDLPSDSTTKGKENVLKYEQEVWLASVPDMIWDKTGSVLVSGHSVTYEWIYSGTYTGKWGDKAIHKKPFSIKGISVTTIDDAGKITLQKDYYDLKSFERQLGVD